MSYSTLLETAAILGCVGVEVRNDLPAPLFNGDDAIRCGSMAFDATLKIFAVAEVKAFNNFTDATREQASALMEQAAACGADGVVLIPQCDGRGTEQVQRIQSLRHAITELLPMLEHFRLTGFIEPLGFEQSSLRLKSEVVESIEACGGGKHFRLVHDTFHHFLAGGGPFFPEMTGLVHVSGVVDNSLAVEDIRDEHRVLVDQHDRLGNIEQILALINGGYNGPVSMEAFAPAVHQYANAGSKLNESFEFIQTAVQAQLTEQAKHV